MNSAPTPRACTRFVRLESTLPSRVKKASVGACEVNVIAGIPDHRDSVLSPAERNANNRMMISCSGSKTPELVIDL